MGRTHRKRILICTFEYPPVGSGIANVAYNLRNEFAKRHDVTVCSPVGPDVKVGSWPLILKTGGIGIIYYWLKAGAYLKRHIDDYDAVLLENPLLLQSVYSPKLRITTHTTYVEYYNQVKMSSNLILRLYYKFMRWYERRIYKRLDKRILFTSASDCVSEELVKLGVPPRNIKYISNGADVNRFKPTTPAKKKALRAKYGIDPKKNILLFVGRLEYQHQPQDMVRIFAKAQGTLSLQLVVVGQGSLEAETKKIAKDLNVDVVWISHINYEEIHEIFQAADYFFINSLYTGQSLAMLEAVASGLPLLVPNITEFRRIVKDSNVGVLYDPNDIDAAAAAITNYVKKNSKNEYSKQRAYAERKVSWARLALEYERYFFNEPPRPKGRGIL